MRDFFAQQERALRASRTLLLAFAGAIVLTGILCYPIVLLFADTPLTTGKWWDPPLFFTTVAAVAFTLFVLSAGKRWQLARMDAGALAEWLGAEPLAPDTQSLTATRYRHVTEEIAIAAGIPCPQLYVIPREPTINAFAAGRNLSQTAIAVTEGALQRLTRTELQGIVAHEIAHIVHGDMRLNWHLVAWLYGLELFTNFGRALLTDGPQHSSTPRFWRSLHRSVQYRQRQLLGLFLVGIGSLTHFMAQMIRAAITRQREFLADATAVQLTRNPTGLAQALRKAANDRASLLAFVPAEAVHLFLIAPVRWGGFPSHPPLGDRIRRLEGTTTAPLPPGAYLEPLEPDEALWVLQHIAAHGTGVLLVRNEPHATKRQTDDVSESPPQTQTVRLKSNIGLHPDSTKKRLTIQEWREQLPPSIQQALYHPQSATQLTVDLVGTSRIPAAWRYPLALLLIPTLQRLSKPERKMLLANLKQKIGTLPDRTRYHLLLWLLFRNSLHSPQARSPFLPGRMRQHLATLLSVTAVLGGENPAMQKQRFLKVVAQSAHPDLLWQPPESLTPQAIEAALDALRAAPPSLRHLALQLCVALVTADGLVHPHEWGWLATVSTLLESPVPLLDYLPDPHTKGQTGDTQP
ncbi:M48 family metalloprotease [Hydrogenophilus thiooxidans]|uniref:M48 family metalloprotease n=1 Tax=Hydrogenophilus thiooxidans TaxID=2820326 RepID=UPI001C21E658|nr:M48 family metalloprotease [Hydrogenophilus thiooxidans]